MDNKAVLSAFLSAVLFSLTACFPSDANLTDTGQGLPELIAEIEANGEAGTTQPLTVTVSNPGPGDMNPLIVSFSRVGAGGQEELPEPLIDVGVQRESESIVSIEPPPESTSLDAMTYRFGPLLEGQSITIVFELRLPDAGGAYSNSVIAYDGVAVERARGVRIDTVVSDR